MVPETAPPITNRRYGRFDVLDVLGRGGAAVVYRALDPVIGRQVALKVLELPVEADAREERRNRFAQEFRSAGTLSHPNLVTVYEVGAQGESTFIAMELVDGGNLKQLLEENPRLPFTDVGHLATQLCSGLDYAHRAGILHRDVKPANILLTRNGTPKLADFGIAKALTEPSDLTASGIVLGTPHYMSPEQITGETLTAASDQFSVAVILYRALTGRLPFVGDDAPSILYKIVHDEATPARELEPDLPRGAELVLQRALHKDPSQRFSNCREFAVALCEALGVAVTGANTRERLDRVRAFDSRSQGTLDRWWLKQRRGSRLAVTIASVALLTFVGSLTAARWISSQANAGSGGATVFTDLVRHSLEIEGVEPGTRVWLDGRDSGFSAPGTVSIAGRSTDTVRVDLLRDGRLIDGRDLDLATPSPTVWQASEPPTRPEVAAAGSTLSLEIVTQPPGASVMVNGVTAEAPAPTRLELTEGENYAIAVTLDGYQSQSRTLLFPDDLIGDGTRAELSLDFQLLPQIDLGILRINPIGYDFVVEVAANSYGPAPRHEIPLPPGTYSDIRIVAPAVSLDRTWKKVDIRSGEELVLDLPPAVQVQISSWPDNATISIDGQAAEPSPLTRLLTIGRHEFEAQWPGAEAPRTLNQKITSHTTRVHITKEP